MKKPNREDFFKIGTHKTLAKNQYMTELAKFRHQASKLKKEDNKPQMEIEESPKINLTPFQKRQNYQELSTNEYKQAIEEEIPSNIKNDPDFNIDDIACYTSNNEKELVGNRIFNISNLINFIKSISEHSMICQFPICFKNENLQGLQSNLQFQCSFCNKHFDLITSQKNNLQNHYNINIMAQIGIMISGITFSDFEHVCAMLEINSFSKKTFTQLNDSIGKIFISEANKNFENYALQAKNITDIKSSKGLPGIRCILDAGWSKISHSNWGYTAKSAALPIIEFHTKKIIALEVANKYCTACSQQIAKKDHECYKNQTGPSTGMESFLAVRGLMNLFKKFAINVTEIVMDGDSSTLKAIKGAVDWIVKKIECINHLLKNLLKKLVAVKQLAEMKTIKSHLSECNIDQMINNSRKIIKEQCNEKKIREENKIKELIDNVPLHIFGYHSNCNSEFCDFEKRDIQKNKDITKKHFTLINNCFESLKKNIPNIIEGITTNLAETQHSIRSNLDYHKGINLIQKGNWTFRCQIAALQFNDKQSWIKNLWDNIFYQESSFLKIWIEKMNQRLEDRNAQKNSVNAKKYHEKAGPDEQYGKIEETEIIYNENIFQNYIKDIEIYFNENIWISKLRINEIQQKTLNQNLDKNWYIERKQRLTSSNFGKICKKKKSTMNSKLVNGILQANEFGKLDNLSSLKQGKDNEPKGIENFQNIQKLKIRNCGFIINPEFPFLGTSPDGIVMQNNLKIALFEQKWLWKEKWRLSTIKEIFDLENKDRINFCLEKISNEIHLKKNHNQQYQIQGQLFLSKMKQCDFVLFTEKDHFQERILADYQFFNENCLKILFEFYFLSYLLELVLKNHMSNATNVDLAAFKQEKLIDQYIKKRIKIFNLEKFYK